MKTHTLTINIEKEAKILKLLDNFATEIRSGKSATLTVQSILFEANANCKK